MKTKIFLIIITIMMILSSCRNNDKNNVYTNDDEVVNNAENKVENNANTDNSGKKVIELDFTSVDKEVLIESQPDEMWILGKSFYFGNIPNQIESKIHLYVENSNDSYAKPGDGIVYGFLEHDNKMYDLGELSYYGIDSVDVNLIDRTFDEIKEIEITGEMGAAYRELRIITYDESNKEWLNLLTMGSPKIVDLDEDGQEELIAISTGSVDIYKWNNDSFEKSSITKEAENVYASLYLLDNKWVIETGLVEEDKTSNPTLYKYENGKLVEMYE
nr:hypothetical protein [Sedimentibacter sp.]